MEPLELTERPAPGGYQAYLESSSAPLTGFLFSLPLFIVYHAGLWWLNTFQGLRWANAVDIIMSDGLGRLGMAGPLLSFILVVVVFLFRHAMSGKPWKRPPAHVWFLMILESLVLALPVFMLSRLVARLGDYIAEAGSLYSLISMLSALSAAAASTVTAAAAKATAAAATVAATAAASGGATADTIGAVGITGDGLPWQANLILSCGAGVYEEFFFRMLLMGALSFFFARVLGMRRGWSLALAAVLQALLFSASHHLPGGPEEVMSLTAFRGVLPVFCFRTAAGIYFACLYLERGFGIAAGSHAAYNMMVVLLDVFMPLG